MTEKELRCLVEQAKRDSRVYEGLIQLWNQRAKLQRQLSDCESGGGEELQLILSEDFAGNKVTSPYLEHFCSIPEAYNEAGMEHFITCMGKSVGHYYAPEGTNESTPWEVICYSSSVLAATGQEEFSELCIEWQEYFTSGYPWPTSGQKMIRWFYDHSSHPESKKSAEFACLNSNANLQAAVYQGQSDMWFQNSGESHPLDRWVTWRVWLKLNTPGNADGLFWVYKDGEVLLGEEGLRLKDDADPRGYNAWWIGGNYSNLPGGTMTHSGSRYVTGIKWYNTWPD